MEKQFLEWSHAGHFTDWSRKPDRRAGLQEIMRRALADLKPGEQIGTTELFRRIWGVDPSRDPEHNKCMGYFVSGLMWLRKNGLLNGCYIQDTMPTPRSFGHKRIWWTNPVATNGLEDIL
jgi:hypothetical protein